MDETPNEDLQAWASWAVTRMWRRCELSLVVELERVAMQAQPAVAAELRRLASELRA